MAWSSPARNLARASLRPARAALLAAVAILVTAAAPAEELQFTATVDKTQVTLGQPLTLTLMVSGNLGEIDPPMLQLPEGFAVAASSQSTSFAIRAGVAERTVALTYVLVPRQPGTFTLGPFQVQRDGDGDPLRTEPITVTVIKPAVPPGLRPPQGGRFTL